MVTKRQITKSVTCSVRSRKPGNAKPRARRRARTPTLLAVPLPHVVLGIDPGAITGYAIFVNGEYHHSEVAGIAYTRHLVVQYACEIATDIHQPLLVIAETWPSSFLPNGKRMSHDSIIGMGVNWGKWLQEIEMFMGAKPNVTLIDTLVWRKHYGLHRYAREQAKTMAVAIATKITNKQIKDHNEAEAILIAQLGCYEV